MKEQLAHFGQENNKDTAPKTLQSLQDMISSLKTLPAVNHSNNNNNNNNNNSSNNGSFDQQGQQGQSQGQQQLQASLSRHEKRQSMSPLPSRSSMSHLSSGASGGLNTIAAAGVKESSATSTSTTLHISQPPRGTTIENALQSTVATLRRLSVSDSKRPVIPGVTTNKTDDTSVCQPQLSLTSQFVLCAFIPPFLAAKLLKIAQPQEVMRGAT
jgi:hypothetical protein